MTALIAILTLLFIPAAMLFINMLRRKSNILWMLATLGALIAGLVVYLTRRYIPQEFTPLTWQPEAFFFISPGLLVDTTSWIFALALVTQVLAIMLTSVARMGSKSLSPTETPQQTNGSDNIPSGSQASSQSTDWRAWAANLALTSLGLVAVLSGNLLTLLFAWAALDVAELMVLLGQVSTNTIRRQVVSAFSTRFAGIAMLVLAGIVMWNQDGRLDFSSISPQASLFLLLSAGLRLGILPIHVPFLNELPIRIGLGTPIRLVPVAASLVLLVRSAETGIQGITGLALLGLTALAGLIGGIGWLRAQDEISGRSNWILATTSLAAAAMILAQPTASLAWSLATLLPGCLIFIASQRRLFLAPILLLGTLCLTGLPYTPLWAGTNIFVPTIATANLFEHTIVLLTGLLFVVIHALLLAGYLMYGLRGIFIPDGKPQQQVDRWVWLLYIPGLVILPVVHILLGWLIRPNPVQATLVMWVEGAAALGIAAAIWYFTARPARSDYSSRISSAIRQWLSVENIYRSFYRPLGWFSRVIAQAIRMISIVLEGEAGILWALVLLVLVLVYLQQS
jgi:formate hydrogenlyase subunit 3/multisubunit Na+/H+ antiporter MnhD subunit